MKNFVVEKNLLENNLKTRASKAILILSFVLLVIFAFFNLVGCVDETDDNLFLFGSSNFSLLRGGNIKSAKKQAEQFLIEFEKKVAVDIETSDVYKFNNAKANEKIAVCDDVYQLLKMCKEFFDSTDGAFNPAVFPATEKWGFAPQNEIGYSTPRPEVESQELEKLKEICNFDNVQIDDDAKKIWKTVDGVKIDFGGVAKGYSADKCKEIFLKNGVEGGIIDVGGNIYCVGNKSTELEKFNIGITHPRSFSNEVCSAIKLSNLSVVTSGDYERFYVSENKRYCHIIDWKTAKPVETDVISITLIDESSSRADAFATAGFVVGAEKAIEFYKQQNITALVVQEQINSKSGNFSQSQNSKNFLVSFVNTAKRDVAFKKTATGNYFYNGFKLNFDIDENGYVKA